MNSFYTEILCPPKANHVKRCIIIKFSLILSMVFLFQLKAMSHSFFYETNTRSIKPSKALVKDQRHAFEVKGKVVNTTGEALSGVIVREKGGTASTTSNATGDYSIQVKDGNAILQFSLLGYISQEIQVNNRNNIRVTLIESVQALEEVKIVSTGYQNLNPKLFTGSAIALKGSDVKQEGVTDVSRMLEGRVAGVSVQNVSGTFGAAPKIRVRGATSITGDNKPLWVIDGVILEDVVNISNEQLSSGDASTLIGSAVAGLNADDIESFNILKDASATAQYGARAMNGVIVITTKKGRVGAPQVAYTGNFSISQKPSYDNFNIMNSVDQMSIYSELARKGWYNHSPMSRAASGGVYTKMYQLINTYDKSNGEFGLQNTNEAREAFLKRYALVNTDWFDLLFKNSFLQEHALSISTGTDKNTIYFSTSYLNDNGWAMGNKVERYTANLNTTFKLSDKVSVNFLTTGMIRNQKAPGTIGRVSNPVLGTYSRDFDINPYSYATNASRTLSAYNEDGSLEFFTRNYAPFNIINELQNNSIELSMLDFKLQGGLDYKITPTLKYTVMGSMRYVKSNQEHKIRESSNMPQAYRADDDSFVRENNRFLYRDPEHPEADPVTVLPYGGFYNTNDDFLKSFVVRNAFEYDKELNEKHAINVYLTQEIRLANRVAKNSLGYGYQYDKGGVPFIDPNFIKQAVGNNLSYYGMGNKYDRFAVFMLRGAYAYMDRYSFNFTTRYDGSNQLGDAPNARWLPTWNVSGAWNIDNEAFYKENRISKIMNRATIRATYGLVGSINTSANSSLVVKNSSTLRPYPYELESSLIIQSLKNKNLTWEKQYETNLGFDLGFLEDKITLTLDLYDRKSYDLISPIRTTGIGGQYIKVANYADMKTKGLEASIGANIAINTDLKWRSNINFGLNKNTVTNLKGTPIIFDLVGTDGGPLVDHPYRGLFSIEFVDLDPSTGVPRFINHLGEKSSYVDVQSPDIQYLKYEGPTDPKFTGGFYNMFQYKNFSLSALFTFASGNVVRLNPVFANSYSDLDATPLEFRSRWIMPGDEQHTKIPSLPDRRTFINFSNQNAQPYNAYNYSSERIAKGDFLKLKNITLTYALPSKISNRWGLGNASLSIVANNFWLIYADKKLNGQDPEFFSTGGVALPIPKQYTLSLKVGLK